MALGTALVYHAALMKGSWTAHHDRHAPEPHLPHAAAALAIAVAFCVCLYPAFRLLPRHCAQMWRVTTRIRLRTLAGLCAATYPDRAAGGALAWVLLTDGVIGQCASQPA